MDKILNILTVVVYLILGIICLIMASKSIFSKKYLPFHEEAADILWDKIDKRLQYVLLTLLKISGLGFFIVFLILAVFPVFNYFNPDPVIKFLVPAIAFIFCLGLFIFNFQLYKKTNVKTPWIGSLMVMIIILVNFILSII
jgi:hypothetical protein